MDALSYFNQSMVDKVTPCVFLIDPNRSYETPPPIMTGTLKPTPTTGPSPPSIAQQHQATIQMPPRSTNLNFLQPTLNLILPLMSWMVWNFYIRNMAPLYKHGNNLFLPGTPTTSLILIPNSIRKSLTPTSNGEIAPSSTAPKSLLSSRNIGMCSARKDLENTFAAINAASTLATLVLFAAKYHDTAHMKAK